MTKFERKYWNCRNWIRDNLFEPVWYRFFGHKHHIVKTKLPPSPWIDVDTRMLYAVMGLVEWFVENDMMAWTPKMREEELARIAKEDEEYKDGNFLSIKDQWAREDAIMDIYGWWKNYDRRQEEIREALNEWHSYVKGNDDDDGGVMDFFNKMNKMNQNGGDAKEKALSEKLHQMEADLDKEEQEMLKKAVDLRGSMWS